MRYGALAAFVSVMVIVSLPFISTGSDAEEGPVTSIYDSLSPNEKKAYDDLDDAVRNFNTLSGLEYLSVQEGWEVYYAYMYDHPEAFWFDDSYTMYSSLDRVTEFLYEEVYTAQQIQKMKFAISNSLKSLDVDPSAADYKQLRKIHDWLCDNIVYEEGDHQGDIYGAIAQGRCVCEGYATAFRYICGLYGFDCVVIVGYTFESSTIAHAWNLVYGEGAWYFVDVTWDDGNGYTSDDYFMVGSETKIHGRVFATEDHMADSLYGISPSPDRFISPEERFILYGALVAGAVVLVLFVLYVIRKRKQTQAPISAYGTPAAVTYNGEFCPECGSPVSSEYMFCATCGANLPERKPQSDTPSESDSQNDGNENN